MGYRKYCKANTGIQLVRGEMDKQMHVERGMLIIRLQYLVKSHPGESNPRPVDYESTALAS